MGIISTALRKSARGEACTFRIPGICNGDRETTVLCHLYPDGGIMGGKGPDYLAAFGCSACHEHIDQRRLSKPEATFYCFRALARTWRRWIESGLIKIPVDPATAKTRPGKKANLPSRDIPARPFQPGSRKLESRNNLRRST